MPTLKRQQPQSAAEMAGTMRRVMESFKEFSIAKTNFVTALKVK